MLVAYLLQLLSREETGRYARYDFLMYVAPFALMATGVVMAFVQSSAMPAIVCTIGSLVVLFTGITVHPDPFKFKRSGEAPAPIYTEEFALPLLTRN